MELKNSVKELPNNAVRSKENSNTNKIYRSFAAYPKKKGLSKLKYTLI